MKGGGGVIIIGDGQGGGYRSWGGGKGGGKSDYGGDWIADPDNVGRADYERYRKRDLRLTKLMWDDLEKKRDDGKTEKHVALIPNNEKGEGGKWLWLLEQEG